MVLAVSGARGTHVPPTRWKRKPGVRASDEIAAAYCAPEHRALGQAYLRENIQYTLGEREIAGLRLYYQLAEKHGVVEGVRAPQFY